MYKKFVNFSINPTLYKNHFLYPEFVQTNNYRKNEATTFNLPNHLKLRYFNNCFLSSFYSELSYFMDL